MIGYVELEATTGTNIASNIIRVIEDMGLDIQKCRGQTYDGAGNMSGHLHGCRAEIEKVNHQALYVHCASHCLNLVLSKGSNVQET